MPNGRSRPKTLLRHKIHVATDAQHGFIIGGHTTAANLVDTKAIIKVINEPDLDEGAMVLTGKGYASFANRIGLEKAGFTDGIMFKANGGKQPSEPEIIMNRFISRLRVRIPLIPAM